MRKRITLAALAGTALAALVVPVAAQASTKDVYMGVPPAAQKAFEKYSSDANDFFPHGVTIHVGDSIAFLDVGFHTIDLPAKRGGGPAAFEGALPNTTISGVNDAAGNPFWFNGQPQIGLNPALPVPPKWGEDATYNGRTAVRSGPPPQGKAKPFTVKFTKKGSYTYYCNVHPGMKGVVHVVGKKAKAPSKRDDARAVKNQIRRDLVLAKKGLNVKPPAATVDVGYFDGQGVEYFGFLPGNLTVKAGTTLTFQMTKGSRELHTATFGPGDPEKEPNSYLGQVAAGFAQPVHDPRAVYPSESPGTTPASLSPTLHGNGFWNSGGMDTDSKTPTVPARNVLRFDTPGVYNYYCMVHPFMHGVITVTS